LPIILGLLLIGVALPAATKLVQKKGVGEMRGSAASEPYCDIHLLQSCPCGCEPSTSGGSCKECPTPTPTPVPQPYCDIHLLQSCPCGCEPSTSGGSCKECPTPVPQPYCDSVHQNCPCGCEPSTSGGSCKECPTPTPDPYKWVRMECDTSTGKWKCVRKKAPNGWRLKIECEDSSGCDKAPASVLDDGTICYPGSSVYGLPDCSRCKDGKYYLVPGSTATHKSYKCGLGPEPKSCDNPGDPCCVDDYENTYCKNNLIPSSDGPGCVCEQVYCVHDGKKYTPGDSICVNEWLWSCMTNGNWHKTECSQGCDSAKNQCGGVSVSPLPQGPTPTSVVPTPTEPSGTTPAPTTPPSIPAGACDRACSPGESWCEGDLRCLCENNRGKPWKEPGAEWCDADGTYHKCQNGVSQSTGKSCGEGPFCYTDGKGYSGEVTNGCCNYGENTKNPYYISLDSGMCDSRYCERKTFSDGFPYGDGNYCNPQVCVRKKGKGESEVEGGPAALCNWACCSKCPEFFRARFQKDVKDPWAEQKTIALGQSIRVACMKENRGQLATFVKGTISFRGQIVFQESSGDKGQVWTFTPEKLGTYLLTCRSTEEGCEATTDTAQLKVVEQVTGCKLCPDGHRITASADYDCDGKIDWEDFAAWYDDFNKKSALKYADFNCDGEVNLNDFESWYDQFILSLSD